MPRWLADPEAPAWVQAVGSTVAILIAVFVPWWQRRKSLFDAACDRARQERRQLQRMVAGLREEIRAASDAAGRRQEAISETFRQLDEAVKRGGTLKMTGPIQPGSMALTDGTIYRAVAAELGRLPTELIKSVVTFYSLVLDMSRTADGSPTAVEAYQSFLPSLPRARTYAAIVIRTLDKLEEAQFSTNANILPTGEEVCQFAAKFGYPLLEIAKERGLNVDQIRRES